MVLALLRRVNYRLSRRGIHLRRIANISIVRTLLACLKYRQGLRILVFGQTKISGKGRIEVATNSLFAVNEPWFFAHAEPGSLIVLRGATLRVSGGEFAIKSAAFVEVKDGALLELQGGNGYASRDLQIECRERITIGPGAAIGPGVMIRDNDGHPLTTEGHQSTLPVTIGRRVWIGAKAIILKGVTIGEGSIVAAGSIVTHDIPAHCLAAGVPAKVVREGVSWT